jgi:hypothetical protein
LQVAVKKSHVQRLMINRQTTKATMPELHFDDFTDNGRLLAFNQRVIDQALEVVAAFEGPLSPLFAGLVGSHLRHIVEHFEALLFPVQPGVVDYDSRARCRKLETQTALATSRLFALQTRLADYPVHGLASPVQVFGMGGTAGEFAFAVTSSVARELVFVASHAVHHYALLAAHCRLQGIALPADFGKAPSTIAYERAHRQAAAAVVRHAETPQETPRETPEEKPSPALLLEV